LAWLRRDGALQDPHDTGALADALLWNHQPAEALQLVTSFLLGAAVGDLSQTTGSLFSLGARAVADLTELGGEPSRQPMARLDEVRGAMALDPFADRDTLPRASADRRQWQAERTRAEGRSDPDAWTEAASAWEALSMPHDAAYCWWRAAEALLTIGANKIDVRAALHAAHRHSDGHLPLRDEIGKAATRARIPILETLDADASPAGDTHLTTQEVKVLRLIATGLTNAEIGTALFISPKTVSVHVTNLLRKLEVSNRTEAATWANRHGLVADL
jgi:DNA-binding CsgD family transcriptional regulator